MSWPIRMCVALVFKRECNLAVDRAAKIKEQVQGVVQAKEVINVFQWCKALLNVESPESLAVVQRFEADSKFFRCFTVMLLVLLAAWSFHQEWPPAGIPVVLGLLLLALWHFMEQRFKATNQAYWSVITLTAQAGKFKNAFTTFRHKVRLTIPAPGSYSTYGALLKASGLSDDAQAKFAFVYLNHRDDPTQLWDKARPETKG